jgi:hypothetical protein
MAPKRRTPQIAPFSPHMSRARRGKLADKLDQAIVTQLVKKSDRPITERQIEAAAELTGRKTIAIKIMIERAREKFARAAEQYVDTHLDATTQALAAGDFETATKASQWAMSNLAAEGARVIDRPDDTQSSGPKVLIGIKLGGLGPDTRAAAVVEQDANPRD